MKILGHQLSDIIIIQPNIFNDERGYFFETYSRKLWAQEYGIDKEFVQDNQSRSYKNVLRGLHYQHPYEQGKLVRVIAGEIFDVSVDLRKSSPTFGKWCGYYLSAENNQMIWIPRGFAHGFLTISDEAIVVYKTTAYYEKSAEHCLRWDDPDLAIQWPLSSPPILSSKDRKGVSFKDTVHFS